MTTAWGVSAGASLVLRFSAQAAKLRCSDRDFLPFPERLVEMARHPALNFRYHRGA